MKKNKLYKDMRRVVFCLGLTCFVISCTSDFEEINKNPYQPTDNELQGDNYKLGAFFPQMEDYVYPAQENAYQMCESLIGDVYGRYMTITNTWSTNFAIFNAPVDWLNYPFNTVFGKIYGAWNIIQKETKGEGVNFAWAQILRVAAMQRMTDLYGPIPYKSVMSGSIAVPYDSQDTVYYAMFRDLTSSINTMTNFVVRNPNSKPMAAYDNVYGGDFRLWVKFANSLKLRMAMRLRYANPTLAQTMAEEAVNHSIGVMASNDDNALNAYIKNPINVMWDAYSDSRVCADIASYMTGYADPRIDKYFQKSTGTIAGSYYGVRAGISITSKTPLLDYSSPQATSSDKLLWMNASEVSFLRAEGALLGWNMGGTAQSFYENGIRLSFKQYNLSDADTYLANSTSKPGNYTDPKTSSNSTTALSTITIKWDDAAVQEVKLEKIITQKWIAIWPLGQEAWSEQRRTGYPKFFAVRKNSSGDATLTSGLAKRIPYPPSEFQNNKANYNQAIVLLGGTDNYSTKLWWDKK